MAYYPNKMVTNRKPPSPKKEKEFNDIYRKLNPASKKADGKDISAVKDRNGVLGHALLPQSVNRSKSDREHRGISFIPDSELKKEIKNKKK